ncbi:MAG: hypothetical protein K940chlam7_00300 [Chlamydiae bacterium]|nr:hypothetical protein [Chlamydiota bacterium]
MVRISKQNRRRNVSPRRRRPESSKTGPLKDNLPNGYKEHVNAVECDVNHMVFIPKIK